MNAYFKNILNEGMVIKVELEKEKILNKLKTEKQKIYYM